MPTLTARGGARFSSSLPVRYTVWALGQVLLHLSLVLLLIEGIFLAEELPNVLERLLDVTNSEARLGDVVLLLLTRTPEVFGLALPVALLIAVYRVALRCRENREFVVLAGIGIGAHQLICLTLVIGVAAQAISLIVSGAVAPYLRFAQRQLYFDFSYRVLRDGTASGEFFTFPSLAVYVLPARGHAAERRLLIDETRSNGIERVSTAENATLQPVRGGGDLILLLRRVVADDFQTSGGQGAAASAAPTSSTVLESLSQPLKFDDLMRFQPRGRSVSELTDWELLRSGEAESQSAAVRSGELAGRIGRSLLCLLAPLLGGLAVTFVDRRTHAIALPIACSLLMCCGLGFSALIGMLHPIGIWLTLATMVACAGVLSAGCVYWIVGRQRHLIRPGSGGF